MHVISIIVLDAFVSLKLYIDLIKRDVGKL